MKLYRLIDENNPGEIEYIAYPIEITEEKLREYLWNTQPYIGGPDDLAMIFMDALSKLKGDEL